MKRKILILMIVLCLLLTCMFSVHGASPRLVDEAGLLSGDEASQVTAQLNDVSGRYGLDVVVVTVDSTNGKSPMAFADDYYDYNDYASDGVLLLVSMEDSDWWISTTGYGITVFTDAGIEYIGDQVVPYLSDGDFAEGFTTFAQLCDTFIAQAKSGDPYDNHNLPKAPFRLVLNLGLALAIGLVAAFLVTGSMKNKLKTVASQAAANDYVTAGSLQLTHSRDLFLYTHLDRREKPKSSSGSSTHTSSSGTTHGGGGGKF